MVTRNLNVLIATLCALVAGLLGISCVERTPVLIEEGSADVPGPAPEAASVVVEPVKPPPTADEVEARIQSLQAVAVEMPQDRRLYDEWQNFHTALRKTLFISQRYPATTNVLRMQDEILEDAEWSVEHLRRAGPPPIRYGERHEGYLSEIDGSFEPFLRYLPAQPPPARGYPLLVYLHGYAPDLNIVNWSHLPEELADIAGEMGFAIVNPFGRSNTDFQGVGEQDVMRVIDEMASRYSIDPDRIILAGHSMGGMGVWTIGAHYPERFAALVVVAARGDYYHWREVDRDTLPSYKRVLVDTEFVPAFMLPNLARLPVLVAHGALDNIVPAAEGRHMAGLVEDAGGALTYVEFPDGWHFVTRQICDDPNFRQLLSESRRRPSTNFTHATMHPRYSGCEWFQIRSSSFGLQPIRVRVRAEQDAIHVETRGVDALVIDRAKLPPDLHEIPISVTPGVELLSAADREIPGGPRRIGPVKDVFLDPFMIVRAVSEPGADAGGFEAVVIDWMRYAKSMPRMDGEEVVAPDALAAYNVVLVGNPDHSELMQAVLRDGPIQVSETEFHIGDRAFPRDGNGLWAALPSPWNPARWVVLQCGIPWGAGLSENHKYDMLPDYIVYTSKQDRDRSNTALCAGFYGPDGSVDPARMYMREPATRNPQPAY